MAKKITQKSSLILKPPFFIISDTHWGDKNLLKHVSRPKHHEKMMLANWRKIIKNDDLVLHLGDLVVGSDEVYEQFKNEIAPQLTGKKYIILGNHDKRKYDYYKDFGFKVLKPFTMKYRGYDISFDHYPKFLKKNAKELHIHGHIHDHTYSRNEKSRWGNINISVEMINYKPQRVSRVVNTAISKRNTLSKQTKTMG